MEDNLLIKECIRNNRLAQKALFDKYSRSLFTTAYRILNNFDDANDALQDAFIEIFRDMDDFRNESSFFCWMKTITVRKSVRLLKLRKQFDLVDDNHDRESIEFKDAFTVEDLEKAIKLLPSGNRTIFLMIEVDGYKHREVAQILNISEGTSKSQLNYSKKLLKKYLKELYGYER